ncbi:transcriptional repressor [SCandidatus Aminicenantes bacterium Aminicenantia_JdfR_composite]|jgi:Fur family ferric uptake transcriptional regulator|nr:transcriptional repressor [SCandidatus Aminicenantes bacterium Aminicenantia_JdfR_composite]MCP2620743.1 transcriptional repressor [Candidatus Aminicenantes bacterium AC-334-E05]
MPFEDERQIFENYIRSKNLKQSKQRMQILEIFLKTEKHLTAEELYRLVKRRFPSIGYATIYRTLKLLCDCGICSELRLDDGTIRYEHLYGHEHHDHLICIKCGKFVEVVDPEIEKLQEKLAKKEGFILKRHRLQMYGICKECRNK